MNYRKITISAAWKALIPTLLINVPFVGLLFIFLAHPVLVLFPDMQRSGEDVTYVFATVLLDSPKSWAAFYLYYYCVTFVLVAASKYVRLKIS